MRKSCRVRALQRTPQLRCGTLQVGAASGKTRRHEGHDRATASVELAHGDGVERTTWTADDVLDKVLDDSVTHSWLAPLPLFHYSMVSPPRDPGGVLCRAKEYG